ncbi:hypothetical protein CRUP_006272 [Coryphaenoides rupestris]|nr:hypothetical protein CRUP_006272 [Coryphaenoides rupestris]
MGRLKVELGKKKKEELQGGDGRADDRDERKWDGFVVRIYATSSDPALHQELQLKLARKCLHACGISLFDLEKDLHIISTGFDEEAALLGAGREFALMKTASGKIYYTGKYQSLGIKQGGPSAGLVTDLKGHFVTQVAMGKAHTCVLTKSGEVWTFGVNNKGQCGRDTGAMNQAGKAFGVENMATAMDEDLEDELEEKEEKSLMCQPGMHKWKLEQCMVCTVCGDCTGYGASCVSSGRPDRVPGGICGCGSGESGCSACGCCKACARELDGQEARQRGIFDAVKEMIPLDLLLDGSSERGEKDASKITTYPPGAVRLDCEMRAVQVSCGFHHSVVLMENGDVYTFGYGQHGQLGHGDVNSRGSPTLVQALPGPSVQVTAGSNHTAVLLSDGQVFTFGSFSKGQLGRPILDMPYWNAKPSPMPNIGAKYGRKATWIGASGDQTFLRIDEALINSHVLATSEIFASKHIIGLVPTSVSEPPPFKCLLINKLDGSCRTFNDSEQEDLQGFGLCLDPQPASYQPYQPASYQPYQPASYQPQQPASYQQPSVVMPPLTSPSGCDSCLRLTQKVTELEGRISVLHQIRDDELILDSLFSVCPDAVASAPEAVSTDSEVSVGRDGPAYLRLCVELDSHCPMSWRLLTAGPSRVLNPNTHLRLAPLLGLG